MIPIDPSIDPINGNDPESEEKRQSLHEDFFCIITATVMIDPVMLPVGEAADRWNV